MLWEIEIHPAAHLTDREAERVRSQCQALGAATIREVRSARSFLIEGQISPEQIEKIASGFLVDTVVETHKLVNQSVPANRTPNSELRTQNSLLNVLYKPGVTDNVADSIRYALVDLGYTLSAVRTCQKYWFNDDADQADLARVAGKVLANDAIQQVVWGPLHLSNLAVGSDYAYRLVTVPVRTMNDEQLARLSKDGQLYLSLPEMQTIRGHFIERGRDPTDAELETVAQTWSEHCSHKTLRGRVRYRDHEQTLTFENLLKETVFAATVEIRRRLGSEDWCVSVFQDNAGVVRFDDRQHVCMKVETHNHPSALEPYGGANTGLGGVIRDPLGTGLGARPVCNTDVFCFAPPDMDYRMTHCLPGTLHPKRGHEARVVVSGVRDYGNRMGIPTVNGADLF